MRKITALCAVITIASLIGCHEAKEVATMQTTNTAYTFERSFPSGDTASKAYDDSDLNTAITAYKFFYPTVSIIATWKGNVAAGLTTNKQFMIMEGSPKQIVFTPNSDTPYEGANIDLSNGPMVIELPPGPLMCVVNDMNQRYVMDMGLPGPDAGKGGKHIILPPGYKEQGSRRLLHRNAHHQPRPPARPRHSSRRRRAGRHRYVEDHQDVSPQPPRRRLAGHVVRYRRQAHRLHPRPWEKNLDYWKELAEVINTEPPFEAYRKEYGLLASLGIARGQPFNPDARMQGILVKAAQIANDQMRVQSFADRRPDRLAWPDRKWEWATLRPENGTFDTPSYKDLEARTKWFYQAQIESPAMFRRTAAAGSLYWLGTRDATGAFLDGGKTYKLTIPQPVPAKLFWSITIYDPDTRSEIVTDQGKAALRSLFELKGMPRRHSPPSSTSDPPHLRVTKTSGSKPTPAKAGSPTSASTGRSRPRSMEAGSRGTLKRRSSSRNPSPLRRASCENAADDEQSEELRA